MPKANEVFLSSEGEEQIAVMQWAKSMEFKYPKLKWLHHIPNGGSRNRLEAINLKRQGVKSGVSDLFLPLARHEYHGLYIEMKYGKNKTTKDQDDFIADVAENGYFVTVCYSADAAIKTLEWYLGK